MEIREPKFNVGDKVIDKSGYVGTVIKVESYHLDEEEYWYDVNCDEGTTRLFKESYLEPYVEKPNSVLDLQNGDTYYAIDYGNMNVFSLVFYNDEYDLNCMALGNCFLTKKEAESELERVKIEAEMLRLGGRRNIKICNGNYYIMYDHKTRNLAYFNRNWMHSQGSIFFDTYVDADKAVKAIGEDRIKKYIFGVEE